MSDRNLHPVIAGDLARICDRLQTQLEFFKNQSILITGGTGFFGKWLVLALHELNRRHKLDIKISVLSRNPGRLLQELPHLTDVQLIRGDVLNLPKLSTYRTVLHVATAASEALNRDNPRLMFDTAYEGTRRILDWSLENGVENFLLTSSGAVYGRQPESLTHIPEEFMGGPDILQPRSAYAEGKRAAEHIGVLSCQKSKMRFLIARCFAFVGPWLPMDTHFAVGNFLLNGQRNEDFVIRGDGTPRRSYMHTEDLAVWLLTILARGRSLTAYNVGSDHSVTIKQTAEAVKSAWKSSSAIQILTPAQDPRKFEQYVPSTAKAQKELGLKLEVSFEQALGRMVSWLGAKG